MKYLLHLVMACALFAGAWAPAVCADTLDTLKPEHPRVLASETDFVRIKTLVQTDALAQRWHAQLQEKAQAMLDQPVVHYHLPDGRRLLSVSRRVLDRTLTLAMLDRIEANDRYRDRLWADLEAAAAFKDWNPPHFLDVAEMALAFAIAYDWLHDRWTDDQRRVLREAIVRHGLKPGLAAYDRGSWWTQTEINWNQVCNGGLLAAALSIADEEPEMAGAMVERCAASLKIPMQRYAPDGGYSEGPGYWHYGTTYNVYAIAALESALGHDFGLGQLPGFDQAGHFPAMMVGPTGLRFNFADGHEKGGSGSSALLYMAKRYGCAAYAHEAAKHNKGSALDLLWYDPALLAQDPAPRPLDFAYQSAAVAVLRSDWDDADAWYVGAKGGWIGDGHSQLDLGSFVLERKGVRWLIDLGSDSYGLPGYFHSNKNGGRWRYYRNRAEGHNTLVVNPTGANEDQHYDANVPIEVQGSTIGIDLSSAYAGQVRRSIDLDRLADVVRVTDHVKFDQASELWWFAHTRAQIEFEDDGSAATLMQDGKRLRVRIVSPADARFEVMDARPLPGSPNSKRQNRNEGVQKLAIHLTAVTQTTIEIVFEDAN